MITQIGHKFVLALSFGIFVAIFLLVFRPYGANDVQDFQILFLSGFGLAVFVALIFCYVVVPAMIPSWFQAEHWQIKKEIVFLIFCFLVVSACNVLYNNVVGSNIAQARSFWQFFGITFSIGLFPVVVLVFLVELFLNQRNLESAKVLNERLENPRIKTSNTISIVPETNKDAALQLTLNDFLFAVSDNNYTTISFTQNDQVVRKLLRLSLKSMEVQLQEHPEVIRVHRSYLVNRTKIEKVEGNARSLTLLLKGCPEPIPVSRKFPRETLF